MGILTTVGSNRHASFYGELCRPEASYARGCYITAMLTTIITITIVVAIIIITIITDYGPRPRG